MTREEAIENLKRSKSMYDDDKNTAIDMAINALSQEPTVTSTDEPMTMVYPQVEGFTPTVVSQEPTDTISRGAFEQVMRERDIAIEQLKELGYEWGEKIEPTDAVSRKDIQDYITGA